MNAIELDVQGMTCGSCVKHVSAALSQLAGVTAVAVDLSTARVRVSGSPDTAELNTRMLNWCQSIRDTYKVEIYTVAVNVSNASAVSLLQQCSGDTSHSFSVDASELNNAFDAISKSIFALRVKE